MRTAILALVLVASFCASAQFFSGPCPAPDSVVALYRDDADRLALARTLRNGTTWVDSVAIDPAWAQTAMNALVAVYNSDLPARDTVVDLLHIHAYPTSTMRLLLVSADPDLPWMQQLSLGITPTGTPSIDALLSTYSVSFTGYQTWPWGSTTVSFETQGNVNIPALCALFAAQPGVYYAGPNGGCCDGDRITDSVYTDHVNVVYSHGWDDCQAGCIERRYWGFNVFPDCSVQYVGSYGSTMPGAMNVLRLQQTEVSVHPNPVEDVLHIQLPPGLIAAGEWQVCDLMGRSVMHGKVVRDGTEIAVAGLERGTYLLVLPTADGPMVKRFITR